MATVLPAKRCCTGLSRLSSATDALVSTRCPSMRQRQFCTILRPTMAQIGDRHRLASPTDFFSARHVKHTPAAAFSISLTRSDSSTTTTTASTEARLTWNDFLVLRKRRRYINLGASAGSALATIAVAAPAAIQYEFEDYLASLTGLDPFIAFGLVITGAGGLGWLLGPFVGNAGFLLWNRSIRGDIAKKEKEFYDHVKRFRADPASSSVNNPVPDYYGEKIGSVADYRRWLKDQRAFTRKKNKNLV